MKQNYFRKAFNAKKLKIFIALFLSANITASPFAYADDDTADAAKGIAIEAATSKAEQTALDAVDKATGGAVSNAGSYAGAVGALASGDVKGAIKEAGEDYVSNAIVEGATGGEALAGGDVVGGLAQSTLFGMFGGLPVVGTKTAKYSYTNIGDVVWACEGVGEFGKNATANEKHYYSCQVVFLAPGCVPLTPTVTSISNIVPAGGMFSDKSTPFVYHCWHGGRHPGWNAPKASIVTITGNAYQGQTSIGDGSGDSFADDAEYSSALQEWEEGKQYNWGDFGKDFKYKDTGYDSPLKDAVWDYKVGDISHGDNYEGIDGWNADNGDFSWQGNFNSDYGSVINDIYRDKGNGSYNANGGWADSADWGGSSGNLDDYFGNDTWDSTPSKASGMTDDLFGFDNSGYNGYYDADGTWHESDATRDGYYDANGNWISDSGSYDADGRFTPNGTHYDENGNLVSDGGYYDADGNWVSVNGSYDEDGRFAPDGTHYDENGNLVSDGGYYDADGNWVSTDGQGGYYDENGNWITTNGGVEGYYDANGHFVATGGSDLGLDYADREQKEAYSDDGVLSWDNIKNSFLGSLGAGGDGNSSFFGNGKDGGASSLSNFLSNVLGGNDGSVFGKAEPLSNQEMASLAKRFLSVGGYSVDELKKGENYDRNSAYTEPEKSWDMNRITKLLKSGDVSLGNEQADERAEKNSLVGAAQKGQAWIPKD